MKFCDKLQKLRKGNNISQEQLADKLGVSRQAVSKWESGQSYPEMDKLLTLCKIFNVSLEELTNDDVKELNSKDNKNVFNSYVDQFVDFLNRSINMITNLDTKILGKCIIETLIILFIISLFKKPFDYVDYLIGNILKYLPSTIYHILGNTIYLILMLSYILLSFLIMIYYFDKRWLTRYEKGELDTKEEVQSESSPNQTSDEIDNSKKEVVNTRHVSRILNLLINIIVLFFKGFVLFITMPICFFYVLLVVGIVINIYVIFRGVLYFGPLLCMMACITFLYSILRIIYFFIFNSKNNLKQDFIIIIISFLIGGLGGGVTTIEIMKTRVNNSPVHLSTIDDTYSYKMNNNLLILNDGTSTLEYKIDETHKDDVVVVVNYAPTIENVSVRQIDNTINVSSNNDGFNERMNYINLVLDDLKDKEINDYDSYIDYTIIIISSSKNIDKIQSNYNDYLKSLSSSNLNIYDGEEQNYLNEIDSLNEKLEKKQTEYNKLFDENAKLKDKLETYESTLKGLLGD